MNLIEFAASLLAPHLCLVCATEGWVLCKECAPVYLAEAPELPDLPNLDGIWAATEYEGVAKDIVRQMKFTWAKAAAKTIAWWMNQQMTALPEDIVVSHVPTVNKRVRQRGYDQAELIAKSFARMRGLPFQPVLLRINDTRQVGANREERFEQLAESFKATRYVSGKTILLIDDVMTTGATMSTAAKVLKQEGAHKVKAAVFAYKR